jgi:tRNA nucleotidyltransferase/poly(A) polymerase
MLENGHDSHNMKGEVIEIANARAESYGGGSGKGYKPHMVEPATIDRDVSRRDFTVNTLLWKLQDIADGPEGADVLDLTGRGLEHLRERVLHTPLDPDRTFSDDPTRMLRAVRFLAKYNLTLSREVTESIRRNAPKLTGMPWDAVRKILTDDILDAPNPRRSIALMQSLGLADVLRDMLVQEPGFAAALGRSLTDAEADVLLDLIDLGWAVRTPLYFLSPEGRARVRTVLMQSEEDMARVFVESLKKPVLDRTRAAPRRSVSRGRAGHPRTPCRGGPRPALPAFRGGSHGPGHVPFSARDVIRPRDVATQ